MAPGRGYLLGTRVGRDPLTLGSDKTTLSEIGLRGPGMKRFLALLVGPLMVASLSVAAAPAGASGARFVGDYTAYGKYGVSTSYIAFSLTLRADHTGTDHFNDNIVWSSDGRNITLDFNDGMWTYLGHKTLVGICKRSAPCPLSNINGGTGTWYAIKIA